MWRAKVSESGGKEFSSLRRTSILTNDQETPGDEAQVKKDEGIKIAVSLVKFSGCC